MRYSGSESVEVMVVVARSAQNAFDGVYCGQGLNLMALGRSLITGIGEHHGLKKLNINWCGHVVCSQC